MDVERLVGAVASGAGVIADAGRRDLGAVVTTCADWKVEDVLRHTGRVYRSVHAIVSTRSQVIVPPEQTPPGPRGPEVVAWFEEGAAAIVDALGSIEPDEVVWTWAGLLPAQFYFRRMAHETAIHALDAVSAFGETHEIDSDLGADGVDEYLERVLPFTLARWDHETPAGSLHLHRTDGDGEWLVRIDDGELVMTREHAKGDAAIKGTGEALFLAIWNRRDVDALEHFGDVELIRQWAALAP